MRGDDDDQLLDAHGAAALLSTSTRTLERWRSERKPGSPPYIKLSEHAVRYSRRALLKWLSEKTIAA